MLLCSGKIFYDLAAARADFGRNDVAIVRLEQIYPLPLEALEAALSAYDDGTPVCWVQDAPENMAAWRFLRARFGERLAGRLPLFGICRPESASPATGSHASHELEQTRLMHKAFEMPLGE